MLFRTLFTLQFIKMKHVFARTLLGEQIEITACIEHFDKNLSVRELINQEKGCWFKISKHDGYIIYVFDDYTISQRRKNFVSLWVEYVVWSDYTIITERKVPIKFDDETLFDMLRNQMRNGLDDQKRAFNGLLLALGYDVPYLFNPVTLDAIEDEAAMYAALSAI